MAVDGDGGGEVENEQNRKTIGSYICPTRPIEMREGA